MGDNGIRGHIRSLLLEEQAHVSFDAAVAHFPVELAGRVPSGWVWSAWQLVEHIRIAEADILAYCLPQPYPELKWPDEYWPLSSEPPDENSLLESICKVRDVRRKVVSLLEQAPLLETVPHSDSHTYLREFLLIADHSAYHVGQIVALRRSLGVWPS
jgi:uncharacterized damage-inducible protein DinB